MTNEKKHVYVIITSDRKYIKVGRSEDIWGRLMKLKSDLNSNPYTPNDIDLDLCYATKEKYTIKVERNAHSDLEQEGLHIKGEWFLNQTEAREKVIETLKWLDNKARLYFLQNRGDFNG